jgi:hypothetical protein
MVQVQISEVSLAQQWVSIMYYGNEVGLDCLYTMVTKLFTVGQKRSKGIAGFRYKDLWISFEQLGTF